ACRGDADLPTLTPTCRGNILPRRREAGLSLPFTSDIPQRGRRRDTFPRRGGRTDAMETEFIKCDVRDYIAQVTIDRPRVNAVNAQLLSELMQVFDALSDREDVRVAILTGGGRTFCAGADIKARLQSEPQAGDFWQNSRRAREAFHSIVECKV